MSLFQALIDAIQGGDDRIGGKRFTRLTAQLSNTETTTATVESTLGFGEETDGASTSKLLVGGELLLAGGRTNTTFTALTRAQDGTKAKTSPPGTLVYDFSHNTSGLDHVYRGILVDFAVGEDLDVIGRNLGLEKCPGFTDTEWRNIIRDVAYLPKTTTDAFTVALDALWGPGNYDILTNPVSDPWKVLVEVIIPLATTLNGRFFLNSGELQDTTGANTVDATYNVIEPTLSAYPGSPSQTFGGLRTHTFPAGIAGTATVGVFDDTPTSRRGLRDGLTNYFLPGGSVVGDTITLGTSPGAGGTPVIVDYTAFSAHYIAENETTLDDSDFYAYLADPLLATRCLLEQIRAAGIQVEVRLKV